jgi:LPXTG-motif cell wall-anchored protein
LIGGEIPVPEASSPLLPDLTPPTGDYTSAADVQYVPTQIGALYGSSNLLWIILGVAGGVVIIGGIFLLVRRRRK